MPRTMDQRLVIAHERANPATCYMVEVSSPDVAQVLRRVNDQFLGAALVSQSPANSLQGDPAGALSLARTPSTLAAFTHADDFTSTHIDAAGLTDNHVRGLCWTVDPAFGRAVLRRITVRVKRQNILGFKASQRIGLQIYRRDYTGQGLTKFLLSTFTPLLANVVWWQPRNDDWVADIANPFFDFSGMHVVLGAGDGPNIGTEYYVVLSIDQGKDNYYLWARDTTASRTIAGVGTFADRQWRVGSGLLAGSWKEDLTIPAAVPFATIEIERYAASSTAIYALDLGAVPSAASEGRVVFERGTPPGTAATLEISTAGAGGPWTAVTDGDVIMTKQQTYHARLTLTSAASLNRAPSVSALGLEFRTPRDVSAEATVETIPQEIDVPWLAAGIGEGAVTLVRTGARDFRDVASELASGSAPVSQLEADIRLGSRLVSAPRAAWLLLDRAKVNNRTPTSGAERLSLMSALKATKKKIPPRAETFNTVHTVVSSTTGSTTVLVVTPTIPLAGTINAYRDQGYYMRVRSSAVAGVESGFIATITNNPGAGFDQLEFDPQLPADLAPGDVIEVHSARFAQPVLSWTDADLADVWWDLLTVWLGYPPERIGRGDMGHGGRAGLPPRVTDIEPGDTEAQRKRLVTIAITQQESGADLVNQVSFWCGGATVEIGGQIVFRQIYPLRNADGDITVQPDPIAHTFDLTNTIGLETPVGLEQRIPQLDCAYGVDTTAGESTDQAERKAVFVDVDAIAWLDDQPIDELAPSSMAKELARWCYNSADAGEYLASKGTEMVVRAASTGLRVWSFGSTESLPRLCVGDRVAIITDQYTDYDPSRQVPIRGLWAFNAVLVSVRDGGRTFRAWVQSLTDALPIKGGPGDVAVTDGLAAGEILSVTWQDSTDGTQRMYDVTGGDAVALLYVHHRLWPIGTQGDPYDFTAADNPALPIANKQLIIVRPDASDGHFRFTLAHPDRRYQRYGIFVPRRGAPDFAAGRDVFKITLDPAPPTMNATMHASVTNTTADVSADVVAGVSDWPVRVQIFEGTPSGTPLVDTTLSAPATLDKVTFPALGGRALPLRELLSWWTVLTNVAGETRTIGPEAADRDALPTGYIQIEQFRADAKIRMVFDDDTDTVRVTVPSSKTKTWNKAALALAGSPVVYTVGDLLDDATTESTLGIDEQRGTYLVEYTGGGVTVTIAPPFFLAGPRSTVAMVVNVTPGPTSYSIAWSGSGVTVSIDGGGYGTPSPSPIVVTRDANPHTYDFKQVSGNTNAPVRVDVPALPPTGGPMPLITSFYSPTNGQQFAQNTTSDIIELAGSVANPPSGYTLDLEWSLDGGSITRITGISLPYNHDNTGTGGHGLDLVNGGTLGVMRYTLFMKDSGGNEVAASAIECTVDHA